MKISALLIAASALFVTGCTTGSKVKYYHASYGLVSAKHPGVRAAGKSCNRRVYSKGVYIRGRKVRSREEAAVEWVGEVVKQAKRAERTGNRRAFKGRVLRSRAHKSFVRTEKRYNRCLRSAGYTPVIRGRRR